jgi:Peptidase A4 family
MPDRNLRRGYQRPSTTGLRRRRGPRGLGWMIALGGTAALLAGGYYLASPAPRSVVPAADVATSVPLAGVTGTGAGGAGGWGRGGYPMMPGPASGGPAYGGGADVPAGAPAAGPDEVSANWSGYAAAGAAGSFTSVSAAWAQPAVTCGSADTFSSFWAGLDGDGTPTVEQTGTEADCSGGAATYQGWYEIFPNAPVFYPDPVQPGDAMSASVTAGAGGTFTLTLSDATQGWTQTTQQALADAQLGSAEVIAEAPSEATVLPLADFGTVNFTAATVDNAPIGNAGGLSELTMESAGGTVLAGPSALTGGSAFSVTSDSGPNGPVTGNGGGGTGGGGAGTGGHRHHHHSAGF